jgi:hypothetical protein
VKPWVDKNALVHAPTLYDLAATTFSPQAKSTGSIPLEAPQFPSIENVPERNAEHQRNRLGVWVPVFERLQYGILPSRRMFAEAFLTRL